MGHRICGRPIVSCQSANASALATRPIQVLMQLLDLEFTSCLDAACLSDVAWN